MRECASLEYAVWHTFTTTPKPMIAMVDNMTDPAKKVQKKAGDMIDAASQICDMTYRVRPKMRRLRAGCA